ncbi:MAG: WYL domain-containing protein [Deltaproteobacteria bacterium]|nr:WYL domain-containing protein [Deltaproteobacteria bacterium]
MSPRAVTFLHRAHTFFAELEKDTFPNANSLAEQCDCSRNTAQRTIYRLRDEFSAPIEYDPSRKGYYLTDRTYKLKETLPPGKDELTSLLLARDLVNSLDATDITDALDRLWAQYAANNPAVSRDLLPLIDRFSSSLTTIGRLADEGILHYLTAAARGDNVEITYSSPWRGTEGKKYRGRIMHVHFSDGALYLKFWDMTGRDIILNASFVSSCEILNESLDYKSPSYAPGQPSIDNWLEGFGVWASENVEEVEISIAPPASKYFAKQMWHEDQTDTWETGDVLIRKMPAIISPELVRRVLSLGRHVVGLGPDGLREKVRDEVRVMGRL